MYRKDAYSDRFTSDGTQWSAGHSDLLYQDNFPEPQRGICSENATAISRCPLDRASGKILQSGAPRDPCEQPLCRTWRPHGMEVVRVPRLNRRVQIGANALPCLPMRANGSFHYGCHGSEHPIADRSGRQVSQTCGGAAKREAGRGRPKFKPMALGHVMRPDLSTVWPAPCTPMTAMLYVALGLGKFDPSSLSFPLLASVVCFSRPTGFALGPPRQPRKEIREEVMLVGGGCSEHALNESARPILVCSPCGRP